MNGNFKIQKMKHAILLLGGIFLQLITNSHVLFGQEEQILSNGNIFAKGSVEDENTIKIRWAPANTKAWVDGKKYGYTVERFTIMIDSIWQDTAIKIVIDQPFTPKPLAEWEEAANKSDYAAVIAQAFYGEDFELAASSDDIAGIINQANELEQRFSTSLFMAENDFNASELAGWAWTDHTAKPNEQYVYSIYLNRPDRIEGDTAAVVIGYDEKKDLPRPIGLKALFGDKSVMLSWNYRYQTDIYHSYHVERMAHGESSFHRINELPVTALSADMTDLFYTDSLPDNETEYAYRIIGITSFDQEGPASDTIRGKGVKSVSCVPYIYSGYFPDKDKATIYWEFDCPDIDLVEKMQLWRSEDVDGVFTLIVDTIPVGLSEYTFHLPNETNYVKLFAVNKDSTHQESYPFLLSQTDSIPPAIPTGLKVTVDSLCVAHLSWDANWEPDLRGYRLLRSFTVQEEKTSISPDFITGNEYADTLSLALGNANVYYALTALDMRYNESLPCTEVIATKPNLITPDEPVFTGYEIYGNQVILSWVTDPSRSDIVYTLVRQSSGQSDEGETIFTGNQTQNTYTDEPSESGSYCYQVVATAANGKKSVSPQALEIDITVDTDLNAISGFNSYVDTKNNYIELFWRKHDKARLYRIYKAEGDNSMTLWKELETSKNRIVDEYVSVDTKYTYTILFVSEEGRTSKSKTIIVNY
jgi:hypothetical protein